MIASVGGVLALALAIIIPLTTGPKPVDYPVSNDEPDYCTRRIFNAAVKGEDDYTYVPDKIETYTNPTTNDFYAFSKVTLLDYFYVKTSFDTDFFPFFPPSVQNQPIDTIVALLRVTSLPDTNYMNRTSDKDFLELILSYGDTVQGFIGGGSADENSTKIVFPQTTRFSSDYFFAGNRILSSPQPEEYLYSIDLVLGEKEGDMNISGMSVGYRRTANPHPWTSFPCSVDSASYKKEGLANILKLVEESAAKEITATATVTALHPDDRRTFTVKSQELPSLETVFSQYFEMGGKIYSAGDISLKVGSSIRFSFYLRYDWYSPKSINLELIEVL